MPSAGPADTFTDSVAKEARLRTVLAGYEQVMVAFSAGVDSTYLLDVAHAVLGERVVAVTADSPSLARTSLAEAEAFCRERGIRHIVVPTDEFEREEYLTNDGRRCYHCKAALLRAMNGLAAATKRERGDVALLIGAIADDLGDYRPGMKAAGEAGARWPLADLGFTKVEVRERSRARDLPTWNRAAEPCLSSRVPYGERVTVAGLRMIEQAEVILKNLGFPVCRARHHRIGHEQSQHRGFLCRIEVPTADLPRLVALTDQVVPAIRAIGYANVTIDLAGFTSGGFNALLPKAASATP
ncbi:MAG TPA: ATP-dependent sacrificial sulfur transferase LarE [Planctomycetota bacterium]|nr:ATP-dependent sacrificial sulfur transferase LarE [Planctomycetota bacterium]